MPFNPLKDSEYEPAELAPEAGRPHSPDDDVVTASTVQETVASDKVGDGTPPIGTNHTNDTLDRVRADSTGQRLTIREPNSIYPPCIDAMKKVAHHKIKLFNAAGKASCYQYVRA